MEYYKDVRGVHRGNAEKLVNRLKKLDEEIHDKRVGLLASLVKCKILKSKERAIKENEFLLARAVSDDAIFDSFKRSGSTVGAPIYTRPLRLEYSLYIDGNTNRIYSHLRENYDEFDTRLNMLKQHGLNVKMTSLLRTYNHKEKRRDGKQFEREFYQLYAHKFVFYRQVSSIDSGTRPEIFVRAI
ncbi:hypothetical protein [Oricola cellulosilytica]|uniref:Uncharacterized protein n=1 Tax=Oricola cellulosilytica TaxID=1429082 RepID=A0A4R0PE40_9HYPH|nr:hypothetical protein [Oricola cellulosilytica]TCD13506.1 hypothetical protein E0D97_13620 [Oricola cellulosilytica]